MAAIEKRTGKNGTTYRVKIRLQGERPRTRTFTRLTDAKTWAASVETDLGRGRFVPTTADRRRTLAQLIDAYISDHLPTAPNNRNAPKVAALLSWWRDTAGFMTLDKLTPEAIADLRRQLVKRTTRNGTPITPATVNRYLAALSAACKWAWKENRWLPSNPVLAVSKGTETTGVVRFLSDAEREALLAACRDSADANIATAVLLALATGARAGNLRFLTWDDVDLDAWTLTFRTTKTGQPRRVPVVGMAQGMLQAHYDRDPNGEGWVFKGIKDDTPADLDKPWRRLREAAGLRDFRFHDLRHTTASWLTMHGASLAEVAEALGHRTLVMAKRYSHQTGEHVRSTLERIAGKLGEGRP
jgi:integrase